MAVSPPTGSAPPGVSIPGVPRPEAVDSVSDFERALAPVEPAARSAATA